MSKGYKTVNTFSRTPSKTQILSYLLVLLQTVFFYALIQPYYSSSVTQIVMIVIYSCSLTALIITTTLSSCSDPSDEIMVACKNGENQRVSPHTNQLLYCQYCNSYVKQNSKHCRQCDRCVQRFDHHCIWINNCIGAKNYRLFLAMIISTFLNLLTYVISIALLTVQDQWGDILGVMISNWVLLVIISVFTILIFNLVLLHIYLICRGVSTYEFLVARKEEQQRQQFLKMQEKVKQQQSRITQVLKKQLEKVQQKKKKQQEEEVKAKTSKIIPVDQQQKNEANLQKSPDIQKSQTFIKVKSMNKPLYSPKLSMMQLRKDQNPFDSQQISLEEKIRDSNNLLCSEDQIKNESDKQSIRISSFFIRNKSLSLFISDQKPLQPHRRHRVNVSALDMIENRKGSKKKVSGQKKKKQKKKKTDDF